MLGFFICGGHESTIEPLVPLLQFIKKIKTGK
ncbi:hypothetical protein J2X77_004727 [Sphingobacterium sp. 2149]|nr:hypothetical protein [Sphingobacterium sp. 2149]